MNDLDTLRPDVAEAVKGADAAFHHEGLFAEPYWQTIRAELLQRALLEKQLRDAYAKQHEALQGWVQRATDAEAELASAARMHQQLLDTLGANDQADAMRIIAQHHARELAQSEPPK